jgi:hypothetical protein
LVRFVYRAIHPRAPLIEIGEILREVIARVRELTPELDRGIPSRSLRTEIRRAMVLEAGRYRLWCERLVKAALDDELLPCLALRPEDGMPVLDQYYRCNRDIPEDWPRVIEEWRCSAWLATLRVEDLQAVMAILPTGETDAAPGPAPLDAAPGIENSDASALTARLAKKAHISHAIAALIVEIAPGYQQWTEGEGKFAPRQLHYDKIAELVSKVAPRRNVTDRTARRYITHIALIG